MPAPRPLQLALATALALLALPTAATAHAPAAEEVPPRVERALGGQVDLRADGLFKVRSAKGFTYTTHGPDFAADGFANHGGDIGPGDPERAPVCVSNPATDYYQEVLYAHPSNGTDQLAAKKASIQAAIRRMNAVLNEESIASGGPSADYKVRCEPDESIKVSSFSVPVTTGAPSFTQIVNAAQTAGFTNPRVDYTIFYDGSGPSGACGTGYLYGDDSPGAGNANNNPGGGIGAGYGATYGGCWFGRTPMHENGHNQGAVQYSAPNSTGDGGHCNEGDDVMCYLDGGNLNQNYPVACPASPGTLHFDCNWNTYFDAAPESGEWLTTHWNMGSTVNRFIRFGGPSADFSFSCAALVCSFSDQSSATAGIASREWDFGDGATSNAESPSHAYAATRAYDVTLTVTDNNGFRTSLTRTVALNDDFANPQDLVGNNATATGSNGGASKQAGEPSHSGTNAGGASVWYRWTAATAGTTTINTCASSFDTLLAVYTGSVLNALTPVVKNDDSAAVCGTSAVQSAVSFTAVPGTQYRIAVDGYNGGSGPARGGIGLSLVAPGDSVAPVTTISAGPSGATADPSPSFAFAANEPAEFFECRLSGTFTPCTSPRSYSGLDDGTYTFEVRASDLAHNLGAAATRSFTVDTVVPDTRIDSGPSGTIATPNASFAFSTVNSEAAATFQCRVDAAAFAPCTSATSVNGLSEGAHSFEVRARDAAGNTDQTPAARTFTVDLPDPSPGADSAAPDTTIVAKPPAKLRVRRVARVSFAFASSEAGSSFECSLDGAAFASCLSPRAYGRVRPGNHEFRVRAVDAAGNRDETPASHAFKVKRRR